MASEFNFGLKEIGEEIAVPVTQTPWVLGVGTGLVLTSLAVRRGHIDRFEDVQAKTEPLGNTAPFGDYAGQMIPNALYAMYQGYQGYNGDSEGYRRAIGMIKATAYAGLVVTGLKYTIRAPRPQDGDQRNSFPSGHSTTVFAFSGYVLAEHGPIWGSMALALSAFTGFSRINDQMHRTHEVLAGATLGLSYGIGISMLQKSRKNKSVSEGKVDNNFSFAPILDGNTKGLAFFMEF